jgi:hypothetical protein
LPNTNKYSAVFTKYSVAEYSAGNYSAEYSADRIVGRSLPGADYVTPGKKLRRTEKINLYYSFSPDLVRNGTFSNDNGSLG